LAGATAPVEATAVGAGGASGGGASGGGAIAAGGVGGVGGLQPKQWTAKIVKPNARTRFIILPLDVSSVRNGKS
jgi:hypothetical protein